MCILLGKEQRLYVALYDDSRRDLDWTVVIVRKSDARPVPAAKREGPQTTWSELPSTLAGGEYGVFRIRSTKDDAAIDIVVLLMDSIFLNVAAERLRSDWSVDEV